MNSDRGLLACFGIVLAFSLLWTVAILIPDDSRAVNSKRTFAVPQKLGLKVNGTQYVLDKNIGHYQAGGNSENVHIIHLASEPKNNKSSGKKQLKVAARAAKVQPKTSTNTSTNITSNKSSSNQNKSPLLPRYAWFALFILYHAGRFMKKRRSNYEEDWFIKSGLDSNLQYYGVKEYEDDFLSVDGSFYGSMSKWNGDEMSKFDV